MLGGYFKSKRRTGLLDCGEYSVQREECSLMRMDVSPKCERNGSSKAEIVIHGGSLSFEQCLLYDYV